MLRSCISFVLMLLTTSQVSAQPQSTLTVKLHTPLGIEAERPSEIVDFEAFMEIAAKAQAHRQTRLIPLDTFLQYAQEPNTIILDTRSDEMYHLKHIKGAVHLNFSDFTVEALARVIPSTTTRILIYCNNNFSSDQVHFASKVTPRFKATQTEKPVSMALNIPTYINLYGYGYENVYELQSLVDVRDPRLVFEGTDVPETSKGGGL